MGQYIYIKDKNGKVLDEGKYCGFIYAELCDYAENVETEDMCDIVLKVNEEIADFLDKSTELKVQESIIRRNIDKNNGEDIYIWFDI